jgi:tetrahydromethanopterin S-methyltransferase subunit F
MCSISCNSKRNDRFQCNRKEKAMTYVTRAASLVIGLMSQFILVGIIVGA